MKSNKPQFYFMKMPAAFIMFMLISMMIFSSCKKDTTTTSTAAVSQDEAAEAISNSVTPESGGMVAQVNESAAITADNVSPCGESFDSSISLTNPTGSSITYNFRLSWNWMFTCSPESFQFNFKGHSQYDAPRMSSNDSSNGSMTITGLELNKTEYTVNTSYVRIGSQQSKILDKNSFQSNINITSTNIEIGKTSQEITSGTADVNISGASTGGVSFSYHGTITFNGNKTATLVMDDGTTYNITWQ